MPGRPIVILLWLIQCFFKCVSSLWRRRRENALCLPSIWFGNKWICVFLVSAPEMRRSVIKGQESTYVSLCDREITPRWQKASATSITCSVLPAIIRSLKAILKWFRKGNVSLPQWSKVLSRWLTRRIFTSVVIHGQRLPPFYYSLSSPLFISPASHSSIYVFFVCWYCHEFPHVFNWLLFATWHHMKKEQQLRIATLHLSLLIRGENVEFGGGSGVCCTSWVKHTSCHFKTLNHTHIQIASYLCVTHHCSEWLGMTSKHLMFRGNCLLKWPGT